VVLLLLLAAGYAAVAALGPRPVPSGWSRASDLAEYIGVLHVHSRYSHDGRGTIEEIAAAAARAGARVAFLTDHNTLAPLLEGKEGWYGSTLVLVGAEDLGALDLPRIGPPLEHHRDFPERTNVEWIRVEDGRIDVRVWERGVGETLACGTGACASLVAASLMGLVGRRAAVRFEGGDLDVDWAGDDHVYLTGPAVHVYDGELSPQWMASLAEDARR